MSQLARMQVRRGTTSQWSTANPVLAAGEFGYDTTSGVVKMGDGSTAWSSLAVAFDVGDGATDTELQAHINGTTNVHGIADTAALATTAAVAAGYQPLDADLTALAALSTTSYGRALLELANQAALLAAVGSASATASGVVELATTAETTTGTDTVRAVTPAGVKAVTDALASVYQPLDSDLTAIAALTTTSFGRSVLALADAAALRTLAGLGTIATQAASSVTITGGSVTGITDLAIADGGTGASTAATAPFASVLTSTASATTAANTTSETTLATATIPATAAEGEVYMVVAGGDLLNNTGGSANYRWRLKLGSTTMLDSAAQGIGTSATRRLWTMRAYITVGASAASQRVTGEILVGNPATANAWQAYSFGYVGQGSATEDLSVAKDLVFSVEMGTASASAEVVLRNSAVVRLGKA